MLTADAREARSTSPILALCLRFGLSLRNLEEIMAERNLSVDHVTILTGIQRYPGTEPRPNAFQTHCLRRVIRDGE